MKKIVEIFLFLLLPLAVATAQTNPTEAVVTYRCLNKPLPIVLKELAQKTGVNIVFSDSKFKSKKTVTINATNEKLGAVLAVILEPYRLTTEVIEGVIVVVNSRNEEITKDYIISGVVRDQSNGEVLPYATVFLDDYSEGIYANEKGFYSFKLNRGTYTIIYNYLGYANDTINLFLKRDSTINIGLNPNITQLKEYIVQEDLNKAYFKYGEEFFSMDKINKASSLLGESDVMRSMMTSAGVSSGADGFGGLSVRGGNNDQNLILYDGVPVQNTGHAFGLISIFNSSVIKDARMIKSAFPSRYGGRLSSYLDIKTRDGDKTKMGGEIGLSTIASHATIEGPIVKNKASFIFSYRRTFADPTIKTVTDYINQSNGSEGSTSYYFQDFNGKISFDLNKKNQISISFYTGKDDFSTARFFKNTSSKINYIDQGSNDYNWGNALASIHWNAQVGKNQYSKLTIFSSNWHNEFFRFKRNAIDSLVVINDIFNADLKASEFSVKGIKWDYDIQFKPSNVVRLGLGLNQNSSTINFKNISNLNNVAIYPTLIKKDSVINLTTPYNYNTSEMYGYVEEEISSGRSIVFNIGLHTSFYKSDSVYRPSFQPRVSLNINGEQSWFNFSGAYMRQYQQALSDNGLGFPTDLWINATSNIKAADGFNFSSSVGFMLGSHASINFAGFFKTMNNIVSLGEGQNLNISNDSKWQKAIPYGNGQTYGGEFTLNMDSKFATLDLNFTLSNSKRQFDDLNNSLEYLYKFDRRYMANANVAFKLGSKLDLIFVSTYQEGAKVTFPTGGVIEVKSPAGNYLYPVYTEKNNYTFRDYIRLDIAFNYESKTKIGKHRVYAGVYNVLNRKNPIYLQLDRNTFNLNTYEVNQVSVLPLLPAISYTLTF